MNVRLAEAPAAPALVDELAFDDPQAVRLATKVSPATAIHMPCFPSILGPRLRWRRCDPCNT